MALSAVAIRRRASTLLPRNLFTSNAKPLHPAARRVHPMEVPATAPNPSLTARELLASWASILVGRIPMLSIEITRECPLSCPGCYAYGDTHLGGGVTLSELNDRRGDELVDGVLQLVRKHKPLHVSLVGGEPMVRHRELSKILPALSETGIFTLVVTSGIIPIPMEWMKLRARARGHFRGRLARTSRHPPQARDLRAHPRQYRGPRGQHPLGDHAAHARAPRLSRRICKFLERAAPR